MKLMSIGLSGPIDEVRVRLQQEFAILSLEGFQVAVDEYCKGHITFFGCHITEGELSFRNYERIKAMMKNYIAKVIADVIVYKYEQDIVRRIINGNYYYFTEEERESIYESTFKILNIEGLSLGDGHPNGRRNHILTRVSDYLEGHHELVIDGFIYFRLKDYRQELCDAVDKAVDDFMMDREYKEFIRLLRYFVDVQEPRVEEVHVIIQANGVFRLLDSCGKTINNQYLEGFVIENAGIELNYDDLLISALITIAPQNVTIHGPDVKLTDEVVSTINSVFDGRVCVCESCEICKAETKATTLKQ
jgi:putative sporulation protein YtxC